jgi:hypothetical protein
MQEYGRGFNKSWRMFLAAIVRPPKVHGLHRGAAKKEHATTAGPLRLEYLTGLERNFIIELERIQHRLIVSSSALTYVLEHIRTEQVT